MQTLDELKRRFGAFHVYKKQECDVILWAESVRYMDTIFFSFDGITFYSLYGDYPESLTEEQRRIFATEDPFWAEFRGNE